MSHLFLWLIVFSFIQVLLSLIPTHEVFTDRANKVVNPTAPEWEPSWTSSRTHMLFATITHTHRHEHAEARQQPAANYFVFNYFLHCLLWWLLWPFPPEPFLYSASASPTILEAFSLNHVSAMLPGSCPIPHDRPGKKGRGQLKVFYPALKADRTCCTRLSKCHFNSKFMNV